MHYLVFGHNIYRPKVTQSLIGLANISYWVTLSLTGLANILCWVTLSLIGLANILCWVTYGRENDDTIITDRTKESKIKKY